MGLGTLIIEPICVFSFVKYLVLYETMRYVLGAFSFVKYLI